MKKTPRTKCLEALQLLARISAADDNGWVQCVSCGKKDHYKDMQGGHFIPKGHSSYWALREENVHPQCPGCNMFGMRHGTASQAYTIWMQDFYGKDFVQDMLDSKGLPIKLYKKDYEDMLKDFRERIRHHEKRIGA